MSNKHVLKFRAADQDKFYLIKDGIKTIETRAGTPRYQKISQGDVLVIRCGEEEVQKTVKKVEHFPSVEAVYDSPNFSKILPWAKTLKYAEKT